MPKKTKSYILTDVKGGDYFKRQVGIEFLNSKLKVEKLEHIISIAQTDLIVAKIQLSKKDKEFKNYWNKDSRL